MRRNQLYLDETTWKTLHARAKQLRVTISELVRQAICEKYESSLENRRQIMEGSIGLRKGNRLACLKK